MPFSARKKSQINDKCINAYGYFFEENIFSIFAFKIYIEFFPNWNQTADRKTKIDKYLCKEIVLLLIYLGKFFLADKGNHGNINIQPVNGGLFFKNSFY